MPILTPTVASVSRERVGTNKLTGDAGGDLGVRSRAVRVAKRTKRHIAATNPSRRGASEAPACRDPPPKPLNKNRALVAAAGRSTTTVSRLGFGGVVYGREFVRLRFLCVIGKCEIVAPQRVPRRGGGCGRVENLGAGGLK